MGNRLCAYTRVNHALSLEAVAIASLGVIPEVATASDVAALAKRRGCTPQAIRKEIAHRDIIAWKSADRWVRPGWPDDAIGSELALNYPLLWAA